MKISGGKSPYLQDREGTIPGQVTGSGDWKQTESHPDQSQDDGRQTRALMTMEPPMDRWNLLYLTLVLHGVGTLMPWNIFINAKTVSYVSRTDSPRHIKKSMLHTVHVHTYTFHVSNPMSILQYRYLCSSIVEYFHEDDTILFSNRNQEENGPSFCPMWVNDSLIEWRISRVYLLYYSTLFGRNNISLFLSTLWTTSWALPTLGWSLPLSRSSSSISHLVPSFPMLSSAGSMFSSNSGIYWKLPSTGNKLRQLYEVEGLGLGTELIHPTHRKPVCAVITWRPG